MISITSCNKRFEASPKAKGALGEFGSVLIVCGPDKLRSSSGGDFGHVKEVEEPAMLPPVFVALLANALPPADVSVAILACSSLELKQKRIKNARSSAMEASCTSGHFCTTL